MVRHIAKFNNYNTIYIDTENLDCFKIWNHQTKHIMTEQIEYSMYDVSASIQTITDWKHITTEKHNNRMTLMLVIYAPLNLY